jgi:hypothetical protein
MCPTDRPSVFLTLRELRSLRGAPNYQLVLARNWIILVLRLPHHSCDGTHVQLHTREMCVSLIPSLRHSLYLFSSACVILGSRWIESLTYLDYGDLCFILV